MDREMQGRVGQLHPLPNSEDGQQQAGGGRWKAPSGAVLTPELFHPASWAPGPFSWPLWASAFPSTMRQWGTEGLCMGPSPIRAVPLVEQTFHAPPLIS